MSADRGAASTIFNDFGMSRPLVLMGPLKTFTRYETEHSITQKKRKKKKKLKHVNTVMLKQSCIIFNQYVMLNENCVIFCQYVMLNESCVIFCHVTTMRLYCLL